MLFIEDNKDAIKNKKDYIFYMHPQLVILINN